MQSKKTSSIKINTLSSETSLENSEGKLPLVSSQGSQGLPAPRLCDSVPSIQTQPTTCVTLWAGEANTSR
jgi:hypothetical protein